MRVPEDALLYVTCPNGCSPKWAQYLMCEDAPNVPVLREQVSSLLGLTWNVALRCANCHTHYYRAGVLHSCKQALDRHLDSVSGDLKTLVDMLDDARLRDSQVDVTALLMEENRGS